MNNRQKYSVCTIIKNDFYILPFFIEHYFRLNFEHIYIFDDMSDSRVSMLECVKKYKDLHKITVFNLDFRSADFISKHTKFINSSFYDSNTYENFHTNRHIYLYNYFIKFYKSNNEWVLFCSVDEFLYLRDYTNVHQYMSAYLSRYEIHSLNFVWLLYGSSYHSFFPLNTHLFESFILSSNCHVYNSSALCNVKKISHMAMHVATCNSYIYNYYIKPDSNELIDKNDYCNNYIVSNKNNNNNNNNIYVGQLNAYMAKFIVTDCRNYFIKKFINKNKERNKQINYIEIVELINENNAYLNTSLLKYVSDPDPTKYKNIELCKKINIKKYNQNYKTYKKDLYEILRDSYLHNRLVFYDYSYIKLPANFDANIYRKLNKDLSNMSNIEACIHYNDVGYKEDRLYKIDLPSNFDVTIYKEINRDLDMLSDIQAQIHYYFTGKYEKRKYMYDLPNDFNVDEYKQLNKDLMMLSDSQAKHHYSITGKYEKRIYKLDLPRDFDVNKYKLYNSDIKYMSDIEAKVHYVKRGRIEDRIYNINMDNIETYSYNNIINKCIFFLNHTHNLSGATIFLYDYVLYLEQNDIYDNIIIIDIFFSETISQIYYSRLKRIPLYHYNDNDKLLDYIKSYNPIFIYSNSLNLLFSNIILYEKYIYKIIFHFHETLDTLKSYIHLVKNQSGMFLLSKCCKIYVVSKRIKEDYEEFFKIKNIYIFPPFLSIEKSKTIDCLCQAQPCQFIEHFKCPDKILFGMCGVDLRRKGFSIFVDLAKMMPHHNFMWVGGVSNKITEQGLDNFLHVPNTNNPYQYLSKFDYMVMTSLDDPCPIVLIEAMYLEIPCIVFEKNITYEHIVDNYHIVREHNNNAADIFNFLNHIEIKKQRYPNLKKYILQNFLKPRIHEIEPNNNILIDINSKIVLVVSFYYKTLLENFDYYKNILKYIQLVHNNNIHIIAVINTSHDLFNNNFKYIYIDTNLYLFGIDSICSQCCKPARALSEICNWVIMAPNKGYDVGPFLIGINFIYSHIHIEYKYIMHIHTKTNELWRNNIFKIINYDIRNFPNVDTIISGLFYVKTNRLDRNHEIIMSLPFYKKDFPDEYFYNGGKVFTTKLSYFRVFVQYFEYLYSNMTDIYKNDIYWQKIMDDPDIFKEYYNNYKCCVYNQPISDDAWKKRQETYSKNYMQLQKNGYRGIPDCQIEHAIERYIGYLITFQKIIKLL
jgi:hypothetical protein